jgi:hypothetical protein
MDDSRLAVVSLNSGPRICFPVSHSRSAQYIADRIKQRKLGLIDDKNPWGSACPLILLPAKYCLKMTVGMQEQRNGNLYSCSKLTDGSSQKKDVS